MKNFLLVALILSSTFSLCFADDTALDLKITLTQGDDFQWSVRYDFSSPQTAMFFWRSLGDYRTSSWTPISKDTHIERINGLDTIWFDQPSKSAEFVVTPHSDRIPSEYTPFMKFSDGGFGVFTGQFEVAVSPSKEKIEALNGQTNSWTELAMSTQIEIRSNQKLISNGQVYTDFLTSNLHEGSKYIYVGSGEIIESDHFIGVIDDGMPIWVSSQLYKNTPIIFNALSELYQQSFDQKIELLYAFKGTNHSGFSYKGGIIGKNTMTLESSGALFENENARVIAAIQWAIAHEGAHLFQKARAASNNVQADYWIHEGGADLATIYALMNANLVSSKEATKKIRSVYELCTNFLQENLLNDSVRNGSQAHYHCGHLIGYVTDAALIKHNYFDFWQALTDNAEGKGTDKQYSAAIYFQTMLELGADKKIVEQIKALVSQPVNSPKKALSELILTSGLKAIFNDQDELIEFELP